MKRKPFYEQAPTPDEVRAAWAKAAPGSVLYQRRFGLHQRAFLQGVVSEHLRQRAFCEANPKLAKAYRKPSAAERKAIELTRAWLEFGDVLSLDGIDGGVAP